MNLAEAARNLYKVLLCALTSLTIEFRNYFVTQKKGGSKSKKLVVIGKLFINKERNIK